MTTTPTETAEQTKPKESNEDRKVAALLKRAAKAHDWRVQVWAQSEMRLRMINDQLRTLGHEPFEPYTADFADDESLRHFSEMKLG